MKNKKVLIVCRLDGFANAIRPKKIKSLLEKNNFNVDIFDVATFQLVKDDFSLSKPNFILTKMMDFIKNHFLNFLISPYLVRNGKKLYDYLKDKDYDILICETAMDSYVFFEDLKLIKILDLPTPFPDELYYGGLISKIKYEELIEKERDLFSKVDLLSFHWHTYIDYVKKNIYNGNNFVELNWGCELKPKNKLVKFSNKPRIVFLGYLGGYWANLPLLSRLSKIYSIDVYGGPKPKKKYGLNYKGYSSSEVLSDYQFGLITITQDKLRKEGFSAKNLDYISYGLPVLVPDWRKDKILRDVSIYYNENNFLERIKEFSKKEKWEEIRKKSYEKSKQLNWEDNLQPLIKFLKKIK